MMFQNIGSICVSNHAIYEKKTFLGMKKKIHASGFHIIPSMANIQRWAVRSGVLSLPPQKKLHSQLQTTNIIISHKPSYKFSQSIFSIEKSVESTVKHC